MIEYKYAFMVQSGAMPEGYTLMTTDAMTSCVVGGLGQSVQKFTRGLNALPDGPWEMVSHAVTVLNDNLLITVMIRRPLAPGETP